MDDPWSEIGIPETIKTFTTRRVDVDLKWDFHWARSFDRKYLLLLQHDSKSNVDTPPPHLRGLEVRFTGESESNKRMLVFRLLDSSQRDIFHQLCINIIASTQNAKSEREALYLALMRTWRWHFLLRSGKNSFLSPEQQKGLIGELLLLEEHLFPSLPILDAVEAWQGPLEASKDFAIGRLCIEAKTRRGTATPHIVVSSEHQLDSEGLDLLFLHVLEIDSTTSDSTVGFSLTDVVCRVHSKILEKSNEAIDAFEMRLAAAGYCREDDYSNSQWVQGKGLLYQVTEEFPRIVTGGLNSGVAKVRYSVSLSECEPFLSTSNDLKHALSEMRNG